MTPQEIFEQALGYYENGNEEDYKKAYSLFLAAAEAGHIEAQSYVGRMLSWGEGVERNYSEAVKWLRSAAEKGDAKAQVRLGHLYMFGNGVEKNYDDSLKWLRLSVAQNNPTAQWLLGTMYQCGMGVAKDYSEALVLYKPAAEKGNVYAMCNLANLYYSGRGTDQNYEEALKWYKAAAEKGDESALYKLGCMYEDGEGTSQDIDKAIHWYIASAKQGYDKAQARLGYLYLYGKGVEKNYDEAIKWLRLAVDQNNPYAQYYLGVMYEDGMGIAEDYEEALKFYKLSASQENKNAQFSLGSMYYHGTGVKKDFKEAANWFKLAAEKEHSTAQYYLGEIYRLGRGVEKNLEEAEKWYNLAIDIGNKRAKLGLQKIQEIREEEATEEEKYQACLKAANEGDPEAQYILGLKYCSDGSDINWFRLAAEQGHCEAQYKLADIYRRGRRVTRDLNEARRLYKAAAEQGHAIAQYFMGYIYKYGEGTKQDYAEAANWYRRSAEQTKQIDRRTNRYIARSQYNLAYMYESGFGLEKNIKEAMFWYLASANQGYEPAMRRIAQEKYIKAKYEEAYQLFAKAADKESMVNLAEMHIDGLGCEKSLDKAINLLIEAAEKESQQAMYKLSQIYIGEFGTGININEYIRYISRCKDIRSQLKLAELYFYGIHIERNIYKTVRIWQNIARQGYKCVNYNLALAYYYGIGVDKNVNQALEYLKEVKDYDNKAYDLLSIITKTKGSSQNPGFRMELNLDDVKGGSILEAEWKYINIKSHHIYQEFNRELKEIIDIYKANPSKESYFWLSRLYRELKYENNEAISEYYFEKSIAAGHLYAKYIKDSCDKELAFSNYDLYLPYNLHDILDSSSKADNECIRWDKINIVCRILQGYENKDTPLKETDKFLSCVEANAKNVVHELSRHEENIIYKRLLRCDKVTIQEEFIEYLWDVLAENRQDTLLFPAEAFYSKLNEVLADSSIVALNGIRQFNNIKYLDKNKNYIDWENHLLYNDYSIQRHEIEEVLKIIQYYSGINNFHDCFSIEDYEIDAVITIPDLSIKNNERDLSATETNILDACDDIINHEVKKVVLLVNQEFCSSTKSKLYNSRVELFDSQYIQTIISLGKDIFKDVPTNTYLLVLNMEGDCNEVTFITDNHKVVVPYSTIAKNEYILNHHIYQDIENQLEDMMVVRLGDLIEIDQTNSIRSNQLANESPVRIISDNEYHGSLLNVLKRRNANGNINGYHETVLRNNTYNGEYIFLKYDNGIKLHIQDNDASSKIRLDIHAFKIKKDSLVSIDYMAYILLSADFQTYMADIVDKNGRFMLSDLLYKKIAINRDKAIQKQIVEDAVIREHQRFGSGVEYNVAVLSENPIVIDTMEQTEGIALLGKDLTFEEVYDKYLTDGDTSILDAIVVDIEHDEYHDVMEVFGDIRELNIHMYIISKEKAVKGKKKVEYFETGNRIFNTDEVIKKGLINKLRDDLDSSNAPQAKIRNKYKAVFEAAEALDKKYPEIGIAKSVMRYIQTGCNIDDVDNMSGPCGSFRQVCHDMLNLMVKKNLVPKIDPGAIPSLIKDGKYFDNNAKQTYILLESFMPKYLSRALEYFCKVTNEGVHGSQDSSRLGTAALNILMDFIVWFYEKDICNEDFENIPPDLCFRNVTKELSSLKYTEHHVQIEESDNNRIIYAGNILIKENSNKPLQNNSKIKIKSINAYQFGEREEKRRRTKTGEYIEFYCNYDYDIL